MHIQNVRQGMGTSVVFDHEGNPYVVVVAQQPGALANTVTIKLDIMAFEEVGQCR